MWINSTKVQTVQNIKITPTGDSGLRHGSKTLPGAAPFYMYENLSRIHDIHYRWGLPFCTPVTGAEFSMICTPTAAHCSPLFLSSLSPFISPSICPPIGALFHPSPAAFHPSPALWSLIISSFHKSNITSLLPPIRPSFFHLFHPFPFTTEWASKWGTCDWRGGSLLGVPLQCHYTLICLLRFHIDFVLNKGKIQEGWGAGGDMK